MGTSYLRRSMRARTRTGRKKYGPGRCFFIGINPKLIWPGVSGKKSLKGCPRRQEQCLWHQKGVDEYTKEDIVDQETGEILENTKKLRSVDLEKAERDAMYDGYFCIITSELDYDERKIRQVYGGLWRVEQSFRIMKTDLYARPVFVNKNEHIRAHFLICFVALLIIRIIQHRMGKQALSAERIARALNAATCRIFKGGIVHLTMLRGDRFPKDARQERQPCGYAGIYG